jgi:hypothetical protein
LVWLGGALLLVALADVAGIDEPQEQLVWSPALILLLVLLVWRFGPDTHGRGPEPSVRIRGMLTRIAVALALVIIGLFLIADVIVVAVPVIAAGLGYLLYLMYGGVLRDKDPNHAPPG